MTEEAASAIESGSKGQSWFWNVLKEELGSKLTQALWGPSVTEKAVRMMEKPKVDLYIF